MIGPGIGQDEGFHNTSPSSIGCSQYSDIMSYLSVLRKSLNDKLLQLETELSATTNDELPHLLEARPYSPFDNADNLPSQKAFTLVNEIRTDLSAVDSLIQPSRFKLVELGMLHYKAAALNAAVVLQVADAIEALGGEASLADLAKKVDVNEHKLGIFASWEVDSE